MDERQFKRLVALEIPAIASVLAKHQETAKKSCLNDMGRVLSFDGIKASMILSESGPTNFLNPGNEHKQQCFKFREPKNVQTDRAALFGGVLPQYSNLVQLDGTADTLNIDRPCCFLVSGDYGSCLKSDGWFPIRNKRGLCWEDLVELDTNLAAYVDIDDRFTAWSSINDILLMSSMPNSCVIDALSVGSYYLFLAKVDDGRSHLIAMQNDWAQYSTINIPDKPENVALIPVNVDKNSECFGLLYNDNLYCYQIKAKSSNIKINELVDVKNYTPTRYLLGACILMIKEPIFANPIFANAYKCDPNEVFAQLDDGRYLRGTGRKIQSDKPAYTNPGYLDDNKNAVVYDTVIEKKSAKVVFCREFYHIITGPSGFTISWKNNEPSVDINKCTAEHHNYPV